MSIGKRITPDLPSQQYANQPLGPTPGWEAGQLPLSLLPERDGHRFNEGEGTEWSPAPGRGIRQ